MRSSFRTVALGLLAAGAVAATATACGTPVAAPAHPVATPATSTATATPRAYTDSYVATQVVGQKATDGTTVTSATCTDVTVNPQGAGTYSCDALFSDNTHSTNMFAVDASGAVTVADQGSTDTSTPSASPTAPFYTAAGLAQHLTSAAFNAGQATPITSATCTAVGTPDASGAATFNCDYALSTGAKATVKVTVDASGNITVA